MEEMKVSQLDTEGMYENIIATYTMKKAKRFDVMPILQIIIASVGICANFTVVFAFLNHKLLRRKVPNMFIINQVRCYDFFSLVITSDEGNQRLFKVFWLFHGE